MLFLLGADKKGNDLAFVGLQVVKLKREREIYSKL